jgi:hypothetical protein
MRRVLEAVVDALWVMQARELLWKVSFDPP